jgi:hypothetical protein
MLVALEDACDGVPIASELTELIASDDEAKVSGVLFDERQTAIASTEEHELDAVSQRVDLCGREPEIHLEANEVGVEACGTREAAEIVFAGRENDVGRVQRIRAGWTRDSDVP